MLSLLIDTSTERGIVAIFKQEIPLFLAELPFGYQNSKYLLPTLEKGMQQAELNLKQLAFISVGIGPGSYTGIRVGVMVAKTLSFAWKIPLVGICSLEGFIPNREGAFASVIDAKMGGLYLMKGRKINQTIEWTSSPQVKAIEQAGNALADVETLVTPYSKRVQPLLQQAFPKAMWQWQESPPNAVSLIQSALRKFHRGEISNNTQLELLYLRKTQAEIEKEKNR